MTNKKNEMHEFNSIGFSSRSPVHVAPNVPGRPIFSSTSQIARSGFSKTADSRASSWLLSLLLYFSRFSSESEQSNIYNSFSFSFPILLLIPSSLSLSLLALSPGLFLQTRKRPRASHGGAGRPPPPPSPPRAFTKGDGGLEAIARDAGSRPASSFSTAAGNHQDLVGSSTRSPFPRSIYQALLSTSPSIPANFVPRAAG